MAEIIMGSGNQPGPSLFDQSIGGAAPQVITTTTDQLFAMARKSSLWTLSFGLACCAIEMISTYMAHHDFDRFGVVTWPSPRQADVTFILLSNSKVVSIAFDMLVFVRVFPMDKTAPTKMTLFSSGNVEYFGKEHTPLALITMLVFITVVVLPVLLVLLYPLAFFQRALRKFNLDTATLRSFVNFFCDSYKTKEEDGTEYRWFPVSYFLLRIAIVLLYGATISSFFFPIEGVLLTAFVVFLGVCRPRKSEAHNAIDIFHMMWFLIFILGIMANITANSSTKRKVFLRTSVIIIVLATALPFLYIISLLLYFTYYKTRLNEVTKQLLRCSPAQRWLMPRKGYERIATHENVNIHFEDESDGSEAHILVWKPKSYASTFN